MSVAETSVTAAPPRAAPGAGPLRRTVGIALPIALAQLGQMAMGLTDQIMLGGIGPGALAAGGLGANLFFTVLLALQGVVSGVAVLAARSRGAGRPEEVPGTYWAGVAIASVLAVPFFLLMSHPGPLLRAVGEPADLSADVAIYLDVLRWGVPAGMLGIGLLRAFLPAVGLEQLLLWIMPAGILLNLVLNFWLIHGGLGLPGYGLRGSAAATAISMWAMALLLGGLVHGRARWRRHVGFTRPPVAVVREIVAIGLPVAGTVLVEAALFLATGLLVGTLGETPLAAHTVALSVASVSFMVPLAISQAANVLVAEAAGAGRPAAARRAGITAMALSLGYMGCAALLLLGAPHLVIGLYLPPDQPAAAVAVRLLQVAGAFQLADGLQVTASGALRGLKDTRVPFLLATLGYWGIGFWLGHTLAFGAGMGAIGLWWGLFGGLAVTALLLCARFLRQTARMMKA